MRLQSGAQSEAARESWLGCGSNAFSATAEHQTGIMVRVMVAALRAWSSLPWRWLPELDLVALRVHDPTELAVLGIVRLLEDVTSFVTKRLK
jgi:hypothetical protein